MSSLLRSAVIGLHVALTVAVASGCAASNTDKNAASSNADETADVATGIVVSGTNGGLIFERREDMVAHFRQVAVAAMAKGRDVGASYGCDKISTCTYDPTAPRSAAYETELSDDHNAFVDPDGHRFEWMFDGKRNEWLFADQDLNAATFVAVNAYTYDVIYNKDTSANADQFLNPIDAWLGVHDHLPSADGAAPSLDPGQSVSTTTAQGVIVSGLNGGRLYGSQAAMLADFRAMAVAAGQLGPEFNCISVEACTYDPTMARTSPDQTYLSDDFNAFLAPNGHRYEWAFDAEREAYLFADEDLNGLTFELVNAYTYDVIYDKDVTPKADELLAPIDAWISQH